ncbi:MAG: MOSC domain-containing protein [Candidatus Nanopelagicales bacterium]
MTPPSAQVLATHIWPEDMLAPVSVDVLDLDWGGPIGDRHHGERMSSGTRQAKAFPRGTEIRNHRQVSIVDVGELERIATAMGIPRIEPGVIADNICTTGLPELTSTAPMSRLMFPSGAVIMVGGENYPCTISGAMLEQVYGTRPEAFPKAGMGLRGITGWVERPGIVKPGDRVSVLPPD